MADGSVCAYCGKRNKGKEWCVGCDPELLFKGYKIKNEAIKKFILENLIEVVNYDDAFIEYIPFEDLDIQEKIGEGGYGIVNRAIWIRGIRYIQNGRHRDSNVIVAVKEIMNGYDKSPDFLEKIKAHYVCCASDTSDRLIRLYGISENPRTGNIMLVMDYKNGNLRNYLDKNFKNCKWGDLIEILFGISNGLKNIHDSGFIHCGLHSGNVLVVNDVIHKVIDVFITGFGVVKNVDNERILFGNLPYIAPEVLCGQLQSKESDIYSFGVIMAEITTGNPPFYNRPHNEDLAREICEEGLRPEINKKIPKIYFDLTKSCLDADQTKRPTLEELIGKLEFWYESLHKYKGFPEEAKQTAHTREIFDQYDIPTGSTYECDEGASYISKELDFCKFSEPKNHEDHYTYELLK